MARIVEFRSSEQPHMSVSESLYYRLAEPLVYRDLDGVLGDIPAACCRRCGEVTLRADEVANHLCVTGERIERLHQKGMAIFRDIVARKDTEAALAAAEQRAERAEQRERDALAIVELARKLEYELGSKPIGHEASKALLNLRRAVLARAGGDAWDGEGG